MSSLEKAVFEVYENAESSSPKETISVLFNPSEYSISGGAEYESYKNKAGTSNSDKSGKKNYTGAKKQVLNLELFFDTSARQMLGGTTKDASDVSKLTSKFMAMTRCIGESHMPPVVCFKWGSIHFWGHIDDIKTTYTMFTSGGKPYRAKMSLTMTEAARASEKYMEPFESPDRTKARTVTEAVSVFNIAQAEYKNPDMWRVICQANNIADPMHIPAGTVLKVPALD